MLFDQGVKNNIDCRIPNNCDKLDFLEMANNVIG
jgi:hypothetical protein